LFHRQCANKPQTTSTILEDPHHTSTPLNFLMVLLKVIRRTQPKAMSLRQLKHGQGLFNRFVQPLSKRWNATAPLFDHLFCSPLRMAQGNRALDLTVR